ncbi:HAD family hydrolase [Roseimaritima sediminicola]|uniref:HAD family hydrolase n=1 Tax=Roseimaritima sediminicola TaxID=2662066 RepID=UPI001386D447|nr:HAD family hydrolase [Roseimaritima sediminicola]
MTKYLLVSDLDDTFLGDRRALERFADFYEPIRERLDIVYASGRFYESIRRDIDTTPLPEPVAVIGGVGSEIRQYPSGRLDQAWIDRIATNWSAKKVQSVLANESQLELQPADSQSDYKVSYFFRDAKPTQLDRLKAKLFDHGLDVSVVYSSSRDLDFLPEGVNKGTAAAFLARQFGFDGDHTMVAGNSGNDSKLFDHDFRGVIVANAHDELKAYAGDARVYLSSQERADGVRDGVAHWMKLADVAGRRS